MDLVNCIRERGGPGQGGERVLHLLVAEGDGGVRVFRAKKTGRGSFMVPSVEGSHRFRTEFQRVEAPLQVPADESQVEPISHRRLSFFPAP